MNEICRRTWRVGFAPSISTAGLEALRDALRADDPRLLQGATTSPPPLTCNVDWDCEAADSIAFTGWQGDGLTTVGEVEEYFARLCYDADVRLKSPADCKHFLNWHDDTPRQEMRLDLLEEVEIALVSRRKKLARQP